MIVSIGKHLLFSVKDEFLFDQKLRVIISAFENRAYVFLGQIKNAYKCTTKNIIMMIFDNI